MLKKTSLAAACFALSFLAIGAQAETWNKSTIVTFDQTVELPGITLPAGTYVFKLLDLPAAREVVQVFNAEENEVLTTFLAIPHQHATAHDETFIGFEERPGGAPMAIREWFFPGNALGLEFVYPKAREQ